MSSPNRDADIRRSKRLQVRRTFILPDPDCTKTSSAHLPTPLCPNAGSVQVEEVVVPELKLELKSIDEPAAASGAADVTAEEADDCDDLTSSPSFLPGFSDSEPAVLTVGTEVSAKYKGAFCEAKIKNIVRLVKCRVSLKGPGPSVVVTDDNINGPLRVGANVEAKHNSNLVEGTITKIMDGSQYTVIFDDGDETTLKRTSLCLKSGKHYSESESLDHLPLTNPEHFGNPVRGGRAKRKRMAAASALASGTSTVSSLPYASSDVDDNESAEGDTVTGSLDGDDDTASNLTQQSLPKDGKDEDSRSPLPTPKADPQQENIGSVFVIEYSEKRGNKAKDTWYPALVVSPTTTEQNSVKVDPAEEFLVKSFKDNRFYCVNQKDVKPFDRALYCSSLTDANSSAALRSAVDKCISYIQSRDLPASWDADLLLGSFLPNAEEVGLASELDSVADEDGDNEAAGKDDQPSEEKDRFVAQLYKFMDERGTPINKAPSVSGKDLDLYRLYTLVNEMGGYNKISSRDIWKSVYLKSDLPACTTDALENMAINQLKATYKKYLLNFTDFYRKLGYSTSFVNSPMASRASSRPARNERSWRLTGLDPAQAAVKETPSVKGGRRRKSATETEAKNEEVSPEADDSKNEGDDASVSGRRGSLKKTVKKIMSGRKKTNLKAESSESEEAAADGIPDPGPNIDSDPETDVSAVKTITKDVEVNTGDKIRVKYIKGVKEHIYEAKIIKSEKNADPAKQRFFVHYAGWNTRYDEWIKRNRIVQVVRDKTPKRRGGLKGVKRGPPPEVLEQERLEAKLLEAATPSKRNRGSALPVAGGRLSTDSVKTGIPPAKLSKPATGKKLRRFGDADAATESCDEILSKNEDSLASSVSYPDGCAVGKDDSVGDNEADSSDAVSSKDGKPAAKHVDEVPEASARRLSIESSSARASRSHRESSTAVSHPEVKTEDQVKKAAPADRDSNDSTEEDEGVRSAPAGVHKRRRTKSARDKRDAGAEDDKLSKTHALDSESKKKSKNVRGKNRDEQVKTEFDDRRSTDRKRKMVDMSPTRSEGTSAEPEDEKSKRKRGFKERDTRLAESCSSGKKSDDLSAKAKPKKEETDRAKKEDEDVNQEIARLFDDEKTTAGEAASQPALSTTTAASGKENSAADVSSTFLLCREEVPLSPVAAPAVDQSFDPSFDHSKPCTSAADSGRDAKDAARDECKSETGNNNFSPPTTPESLRSGTLSSLTPPHEREGQDPEPGKSCHQNLSSSNSDAEANETSKTRPNAPTKNAFGSPPHLSDDSGCSRGAADGSHMTDLSEKQGRVADGSATGSPKRKRRGRARAASTSEPAAGTEAEGGKKVKYGDKHAGYKTRGSSAKRSARYPDHDRYSPIGSASDQPGSHPISPVSGISLSQLPPNAFFANIQPISKYNFCTPLPEDLDSDRRIQILNDRIQELRKTYMNLKSELAAVERRKKKCKRKANGCPEKRLLDKSMSQDLSSDASDKAPNARESSNAS